MMSNAIIGYTGFVGSSLAGARHYDARFNSKNIEEISDQSFQRIVCAGIPAVKWWANKNPDSDLATVERLLRCVLSTDCEEFILISTIDVYPQPVGCTEADIPATQSQQPYGRHRFLAEKMVRDHFGERATIIRLPGLFGAGLKKNVLFDLATDNQLNLINPDSAFQWYPVERLDGDINMVQEAGVKLLNVVTEPITTGDIQRRFRPECRIGADASPTVRYDNRTLYPDLLSCGDGTYHLDRGQVLDAMAHYFAGAIQQ